jgi:protein-tyrosine phosphatase
MTTLYRIDDEGHLYISPAVRDWAPIQAAGVDVVIDLEGGLDSGVPTAPGSILYVYFPIYDEELPNLAKLRGLGRMGASLIREGHRLLSHCGMGYNRSALMAGVILHELGLPGEEIVRRLRERRTGALFNDRFREYISTLGAGPR